MTVLVTNHGTKQALWQNRLIRKAILCYCQAIFSFLKVVVSQCSVDQEYGNVARRLGCVGLQGSVALRRVEVCSFCPNSISTAFVCRDGSKLQMDY